MEIVKKIISVLFSFAFVFCLSFSAYAKEKSILDFDFSFFDFLPWDIQTGKWKDSKDSSSGGGTVIDGEDPEQGRIEEGKKSSSVADVVKKEVKSVDLVIILDKSGSMYNMTEDTIDGFNSYLEEQRKKDVPVKVSVGMFNQVLDAKYDRIDLKEIQNLTKEDYISQGSTALLDAVGNTLSALKLRSEVNAEGNKVLVIIITDGMENASKEWTKEAVKKLIVELQEKGYEFVFLGADIDAVGVAHDIGIKEENSMKFKKTGVGVQANFKAMNVMIDAVSAGNSLVSDSKWRKSIVEDK